MSPFLQSLLSPPSLLALAAVLMFGFGLRAQSGLRAWFLLVTRRKFLLTTGFIAAITSLLYLAYYLRGEVRQIDATSYFLEGRMLSEGHMAWDVPTPAEAFRGRFLHNTGPNTLSVIFPPGYPLYLALGFVLGAPTVMGPLLAALLVWTTYFLTLQLGHSLRKEALVSKEGSQQDASIEYAARAAAVFSILCAAVRYHTADTMSHALTAITVALALAFSLRLHRTRARTDLVASGFFAGYTVLTRPLSGFGVCAIVAVLWLQTFRHGAAEEVDAQSDAKVLAAWPGVLSASLPIALLFVYFRETTGSFFLSTQRAYYAIADGPFDCFRLGFGNVGCVGEHGDFLSRYLPNGTFGIIETLATTGRRIAAHARDLGNSEVLSVVLLVFAARAGLLFRGARVAITLVLLHVVLYVPFYFDGNINGGGARFFVDVLPVEFALAALGLSVHVPFRRSKDPSEGSSSPVTREGLYSDALGRYMMVFAAMALSFAFRSAPLHAKLLEAPGPYADLEKVRGLENQKGLLFVSADHSFNLLFEPDIDPKKEVLVVRHSPGDDRDRLVYEQMGKPTSRRYLLDQNHFAHVEVFSPVSTGGEWRFEAENNWPLLAAHGSIAGRIVDLPSASQGRVIRIEPIVSSASPSDQTFVVGSIPRVLTELFDVTPKLIGFQANDSAVVRLEILGTKEEILAEWETRGVPAGPLPFAPKRVRSKNAIKYRLFSTVPLGIDAFLQSERFDFHP